MDTAPLLERPGISWPRGVLLPCLKGPLGLLPLRVRCDIADAVGGAAARASVEAAKGTKFRSIT